jgi:Glucodextranase, domain B/6-bladed beta-propeller
MLIVSPSGQHYVTHQYNDEQRRTMMMKSARGVIKVLAISLAIVAISRGGAVTAATLPVATLQAPIEKGLRTPTRLAVGTDGSLYVADPANQGVVKFSSAGAVLKKIAVAGIPQGVAVTSSGNILVSQKEFVAVYDTSGAEIKRLGSGNGQFVSASGITLDDAGKIYVADSKGRSVQVFDANGAYLTRFGTQGSAAGQFLYPTAIAYEKVSQQIAVVDSLNARVQFYDKTGTYLRTVGGIGTGPLKFMHPQGIAFEYGTGSAVRMYVADAMLKNIQAIDPTGTGSFISFVKAGKGTEHGSPSDLAFDQNSKRLYIVDGMGSITIYKINDGSVVINSVTPAAATVLASAAQTGKSSVVASVNSSSVAPIILSMVADAANTNSDLLDVSGLTNGASSVKVNGAPVAVANGFFTTAVPLQSGANVITVAATDQSGKAWTETRTIVKSSALPALTIATPDVQATDKATMVFSGTVDKDVFVTVAGVPATIANQTWNAEVTLAPGLNTVEVQAIDLNGQATTQKRTVISTPSAPALAIIAPVEDITVIATKSMVVSGTVAADAVVTAEVNGKSVKATAKAGIFTLPVAFGADGVYSVSVHAAVPGGMSSTIGRSIIYRKK